MHLTCTHTHDVATGSALDDHADEAGIIPFADECPAPRANAVASPSPSACPAPPSGERVSIADRELGIERNKWQRRGRYSCPCCGHASSRVVRVLVPTHTRWSAVCAVCAAMLLAKMPGTIVGGMVRPTRRRRKTNAGADPRGFRRMDQDRKQNHYRRAG